MWSRTALVYCLVSAVVICVCAQADLYEGDTCRRVAGVKWTCRKLKDCIKAQDDLRKGRRPQICNFDGTGIEAVVCCEPSQRPTPTVSTPNPPTLTPRPTKGQKSKQMCLKYAEYVYYKVKDMDGNVVDSIDTCALIEPLITNGTKTQPREYPHMALIGYGNKNNIQWRCGGSLISERWVLSAAHCTLTGEDRPKWVRLGDYNIKSTRDDEENNARSVEFDIIQLINHPQYDITNNYNDIALYKLNKDVEFNEYVRPICLHTDYKIPKRDGIITGWGRLEFGGKTSDILQKGNVTFMSGKQCRDSLNSIPNLKKEIRDNTMLCAANFLSNTDTCQGDSGGPLQYRLRSPYCMYSQVGITSFGIKCGINYPAVYTRVSYFVPWIEKIVWP